METLPVELNYTILSYLDYDDIDNVLFITDQLNYKDLFKFAFPTEYKDILNIFKIDEGVRKYRNEWNVLYHGYSLMKNLPVGYIPEHHSGLGLYYPQYEDTYICNPIFISIFYTIKLYQEYPEWVWIRNKLIKSRKFTSDSLSSHIVKSLEYFTPRTNYTDELLDPTVSDNTEIGLKKYSWHTNEFMYMILLFVYIDEPNFWMSLDEFIKILFDAGYNNYGRSDPKVILAYREFYFYAIKYKENKMKYKENKMK